MEVRGAEYVNTDPSPVVAEKQKSKNMKYAGWIQFVKTYYRKKQRKKPIFLPIVISTTGEFSPELFLLIEMMAGDAKRRKFTNPGHDGMKPSVVSAMFRNRAKTRIAVCNTKGFAAQQMASGLPMGRARWA